LRYCGGSAARPADPQKFPVIFPVHGNFAAAAGLAGRAPGTGLPRPRNRRTRAAMTDPDIPDMAATVAALYRYPVKGLSAEKMNRVALAPGRCLPQDRRFAIALGSTSFDPQHPEWLAKTRFIMLMRDEKLARLQTRFDEESGVLTVDENGRLLLRGRITEPQGRRLVAEFFADFLGGAVDRPLRVVEAPGHAFADARRKPNATADQYVSLINRASIAALEAAIGVPVDPIRFRANVYFDGAPAWSEHD
jgi:uncharacterized protein